MNAARPAVQLCCPYQPVKSAPLFREWLDVRRLVAHPALIVRADIPIPDVVTPYDEDVGFLRLRERACSRNGKGNYDKPHNSCFDFHKFELVCYLWLGRVTH